MTETWASKGSFGPSAAFPPVGALLPCPEAPPTPPAAQSAPRFCLHRLISSSLLLSTWSIP